MREIIFSICGITLLLAGCQSPLRSTQQPLPTPEPGAVSGMQPAAPASNPVVPAGYDAARNTVVPAVALEPLPEQEGEIPMSRVGPPASIITPPPSPPADLTAASLKRLKMEKERKGFDVEDLAPENIIKNIKNATGYGPSEQVARQAFNEGKELFRQQKYTEAADKFSTAAVRWPDSPLEEDALFYQAECYFFADRYPKAHDTYSELLKKYSNSRHLDKAVAREFAIGRYWEQLQDAHPLWVIQPNLTDSSRPHFDTFGNSLAAYRNVRLYDPLGPLADDSVMASAVAQFRRNHFEEASEDFKQLRKDYPNSKHQMNALLLGLQAEMRKYPGSLYDRTALDEAYDLADTALKQYGAKLGPEQARVAKARALILEEKANRIFVLGQYYEKNKYHGAARICYENLIDEYPSTAKAKQARARLDAIKDLPDNPTNYFKWMSDLLPTSKKL
ncbi:MAG: tetratricopeptide repeat protein [Pirellulales bacterium]|nr:tetratricopeptide repeat protein [Pirellulales bacterium]